MSRSPAPLCSSCGACELAFFMPFDPFLGRCSSFVASVFSLGPLQIGEGGITPNYTQALEFFQRAASFGNPNVRFPTSLDFKSIASRFSSVCFVRLMCDLRFGLSLLRRLAGSSCFACASGSSDFHRTLIVFPFCFTGPAQSRSDVRARNRHACSRRTTSEYSACNR